MGYNSLLTIGAALLLGTLLVSTLVLISYNESDSIENEYILAAYGAAQSLIDEAKTRSFDEQSVGKAVQNTSGFTLPGSLGYDGPAEAVPSFDTMVTSSPFSSANPGYPASVRFDDIDDYHGYARVMKAARGLEGDTVRVSVTYALLDNDDDDDDDDDDDPDEITPGSRTLCKTMTVTVSGKYLKQPVTLSYAFTY